ncbi:MAG: sigma 54-interacting transcriptional regulator [Candidatus Poribacteria bacterium]|nr:sigma 54-interacting transcriptional regulator [Candidatus Poribacteria bacterium]
MTQSFIKPASPYIFGDFQTACPQLIKALKKLEQICKTDLNVVLKGKSGTGKELIAQAIHQKSSRRKSNFVPVNCASIPENLFESELFGYERGAFTGAETKKLGQFVLANSGTLFLDEIGELPMSLQPKLLRVLETKEVIPVGGHRYVPADFRLICATHRNLKAMVQKGTFREDLYYRLLGFRLKIPPLRKRPEDIYVIGEYFLKKYAQTYRKSPLTLSPAVWSQLLAQKWSGNARELATVICHAVVLCNGDRIRISDLPEGYQTLEQPQTSLKAFLESRMAAVAIEERNFIIATLDNNDWNREETAKVLCIDRKTLYRKMKKWDIAVLSKHDQNNPNDIEG